MPIRFRLARRTRRGTFGGFITIVVGVALATLSLAGPASAVTGWTSVQTAVPATHQPFGGSIALDAAGHSYIAYARPKSGTFTPGSVWIATNKSGTWVRSKVLTGMFENPSIALDGKGKVHLALQRDTEFCDPGGMCQGLPAGISYATNRSGHWVVTKVSTGTNQVVPVLRLNSGKPLIAYRSRAAVFFASNASGHWVNTKIATIAVTGGVEFELGAGGIPHFVYANSSELRHAWKSGGTVHREQVDPTEVNFAQDGDIVFGSVGSAILLWAAGPMGDANGPAIHLVSSGPGVGWGKWYGEPFLIDYADGRPFRGLGAGVLRGVYTTVGRGVGTFTMSGTTVTLLSLTTANGQDDVRDMALTSAGKMRVLFSSSGALRYLGEI
jgi:hypothetical protein